MPPSSDRFCCGPARHLGTNSGTAPKGASDPYVGMLVCTSGALSGARCDIRVVATGVWYYLPSGVQVVNQAKAEQISLLSASGEGDSGGPVFSLVNNYADVWARGIISAGDDNTSVACTGYYKFGEYVRRCYWRMYFGTIQRALSLQLMDIKFG